MLHLRRRTLLLRQYGLRILHHQPARDALVEQQLHRLHQRVRMEARLPDVGQQHVGECHQRHAYMMREISAHEGHACAGIGTRVIQRVAEAVFAKCAKGFQSAQVGDGARRIDERRKCGGVRRDDEVATQPAFQREIGNAECAILVGLVPVANIVGTFAQAPRYVAAARMRYMTIHRAFIRLRQQRERQ